MELLPYLGIIGAYTSIVVWGVRLEGRINGHDVKFAEREKSADDRHVDLIRRLERIERKIDNGNSK